MFRNLIHNELHQLLARHEAVQLVFALLFHVLQSVCPLFPSSFFQKLLEFVNPLSILRFRSSHGEKHSQRNQRPTAFVLILASEAVIC